MGGFLWFFIENRNRKGVENLSFSRNIYYFYVDSKD